MRRLNFFTSTYNFIQTAGIRDGASHCAKILSVFYDSLDTTSDPNDPEVIIKIDICETLSNMFGYFHAMRTCHAKLRYFDWDGQAHLAKGKTGGQQGDPLEMLVFNLTTLHSWGRTLAKHPQARAIAYADDGYITAGLSVALQVLAELKHVLKKDAGLELNVFKTSVLPKGITQQGAFDVAHNIINALTHLSSDVSLASFCPEGFVGIGCLSVCLSALMLLYRTF